MAGAPVVVRLVAQSRGTAPVPATSVTVTGPAVALGWMTRARALEATLDWWAGEPRLAS